MHVDKLLHKLLSNVIHLKRLASLSIFVSAVLQTKKLSLTNLGRACGLDIQERSGIRRSDRFLGNKRLHSEREEIFRVFISQLIGNKTNPKIIVDWSPIPNVKLHVLRAALITDGRALTLYEEVHPEKKLGNARVQKKFLFKLQLLLPTQCKPIIVTDAGFHNEWFLTVFKLGWDYIGRVRGLKKYKFEGFWHQIKTLVAGGTSTPEYIGKVELCKNQSILTHLYRIKNVSKGRRAFNLNQERKNDTQSKKHSKSAKEAWVLATSLKHNKYTSAKRVIKIFTKRMQIEEGFRDLKSSKYGFSFNETFSRKINRIEVLLLIAMIASLIAWMIGYIGERRKLQYQFQANSTKSHRVLSLFFLGCQMIRKKIKVRMLEFEYAFFSIQNYSTSEL